MTIIALTAAVVSAPSGASATVWANSEVTPDSAGPGTRLHAIQFNVCDQYQNGNASPVCRDDDYVEKASMLYDLITAPDWQATIITLQEICGSTFNLLQTYLSGMGWTGYRATTVLFSTTTRCQRSDDRTWGIGILVKGSIYGYDNDYIGNDPDDGEVRRLLCGDVSMGRGQRICSTHLTNMTSDTARAENYSQFSQVRTTLNGWVGQGHAVTLGADLNRDVLSCTSSDDLEKLRQLYATDLGPYPFCDRAGYGSFYESDRRDRGSGDHADESTLGTKKLDYYFVNTNRFYADYGAKVVTTTRSDHDALHAAITIH